MGTDARVRYTKMVIKDRFAALLEKKPLNKITVKELCESAEINRATFYRYYRDPYDLMENLEREFLGELLDAIREPGRRSFRETLVRILREIEKNGGLYRVLFSENGDPHFPNRIFDLCYQNSSVDVAETFQSLSPSQRKWLYYFTAMGCGGVLEQWMRGGMAEPAEEVAEFAAALLENGLGAFRL